MHVKYLNMIFKCNCKIFKDESEKKISFENNIFNNVLIHSIIIYCLPIMSLTMINSLIWLKSRKCELIHSQIIHN